VKAPTTRPVFISGPFASPYSTALNYDNVVLVASGVGITPALGIINTHKSTKRVNLIWSCREPSLVEFYLENTRFDEEAWTLIYYTGKRR
jgi:ferredoxin-NADP reductase